MNNLLWLGIGLGIGWYLWGRPQQLAATTPAPPGLLPFINPQTGLPQIPSQVPVAPYFVPGPGQPQ
jgi:hypothetical protein